MKPQQDTTDPRLAGGLGEKLKRGLLESWSDKAHLPLIPLGALYGLITCGRRKLHKMLGNTAKATRPVISLGNLTVGGTGKTPLCLQLAKLLMEHGHTPAVLSRGYGRQGDKLKAPLIVSRGDGPLVGVEQSGDEPWLMANQLKGLKVVIDPCRAKAAAVAVEQLGASILILDDGFQHLGLMADCRILLISSKNPFGNGKVIPAGPLREPLPAHRLADIIISTGSTEPSPEALKLAEGRPIFSAKHHFLGWQKQSGGQLLPLETLKGRSVFAFCGLGRPDSFERTLQELGLDIRRFVALTDHQVYDHQKLNDLGLSFLASGAEVMVTTAKDAVKLPPNFPLPLLILQMEMLITPPRGNQFLETVLSFAKKKL